MAKYTDEIKNSAQSLYIKQWSPKDIARELNLPVRTIYHWADTGQWASLLPVESVETAIARRIDQLSKREKKTALELEELRDLVAQHVKLMAQSNKHTEKMAEIQARNVSTAHSIGGGEFADGQPESGKRKNKKNDVSGLNAETLDK